MFDVGAPELLVIAIVMIVVVGPKELPKMLRAFGRMTTKMRSMAGDFRKQFDEAMREAELDDVKNMVNSVRNIDPLAQVKKELNPLSAIGRGIREDVEKAVSMEPVAKPMETPEVKPASGEAVAAKPLKGPVAQSAKPVSDMAKRGKNAVNRAENTAKSTGKKSQKEKTARTGKSGSGKA